MICLFLYYAVGILTTMDISRRMGGNNAVFSAANMTVMLLAGVFWPAIWMTYYPFLSGKAGAELRLAEAKERDRRLAYEVALEMEGRSEVNRFLADNPIETIPPRYVRDTGPR